jgi:phosphohistidine phosphatase
MMFAQNNPRRLFLMRHALAMPPISGGDDKARVLSPKGLSDASMLGRIMMRKNYMPDYILCSTAVRTRQTLEKLMQSLPKTETAFVDKLYDGGTESYVREIQKIPAKYKSVLLVGHNPCVCDYALSITAQAREALLERLHEGCKPATLVALNCNIEDWALLETKAAEITDYLDPIEYNSSDRPTRWM